MKRQYLIWLSMLFLSVLVHAVAAITILHSQETNIDSGKDTGEDGIEVGFGQVGSYLEARKTLIKEREEKDKIANPPKHVKITKAEPPKKAIKEKAKEKPIFNKPVTKPSSIKTTLDTALQTKEAAPIKNEVSDPKTDVDITTEDNKTDTTDNSKLNKASHKVNTQLATGKKSSENLGSKKGDANKYFSQLKNWLNQHKQYPPQLRKHKVQGVVTVRFTIDKTGALKKSSIKLSSGYSDLDEAALQLLENANPMPKFPKSFEREKLTISLPIEYALIDE